MKYNEGKEHFIKAWGDVSTNWGINKTMGQIHALLLIADKPMNADNIIEELDISSGNANMNIKSLLGWGLIQKKRVDGCRKDYYIADKNLWEVFRKIILERKRKELDPMIQLLEEVSSVEGMCKSSNEFCRMVKELKSFSSKADGALSNFCTSKPNWFFSTVLRSMR